MREVIDRIGRHSAQRDQCLEILNLWAVAEEAGYKPCEIKVFTFRDEFLSRDEKRQFSAFRGGNRLKQNNYHNCVKLTNGDLKPIPLTKKPRDLP